MFLRGRVDDKLLMFKFETTSYSDVDLLDSRKYICFVGGLNYVGVPLACIQHRSLLCGVLAKVIKRVREVGISYDITKTKFALLNSN